MSGPDALGVFGAGCAAAGLILWLTPRGTASKAAACGALGAGLAGLLAATGLDRTEERAGGVIDAWLWTLRDGPWEFVVLLPLVGLSIAAFTLSLAVSLLWLGEAAEAAGRKERREAWTFVCGAIGAFGWAMTVVHLWGIFRQLWSTDLFMSVAPPRGLVEGTLTALDMAGLVAAFQLPPRKGAR